MYLIVSGSFEAEFNFHCVGNILFRIRNADVDTRLCNLEDARQQSRAELLRLFGWNFES